MKTVHYPKTTFTRSVKTFCRVCNKKLKRVISDYFTINPWNKRTHHENVVHITEVLDNAETSLTTDGTICRKCEALT